MARKGHKIEEVNRYCEMIQKFNPSSNNRAMLVNMHHNLINLDLRVLPMPILANICGAVSICLDASIRSPSLEHNI